MAAEATGLLPHRTPDFIYFFSDHNHFLYFILLSGEGLERVCCEDIGITPQDSFLPLWVIPVYSIHLPRKSSHNLLTM